MRVKLTEWAKLNGIHPKTAYRWYREGTMPYPTTKIGPRTIVVDVPDDTPSENEICIYARVSSQDQKEDLDRQVSRLLEHAALNQYIVTKIIKEIGSGLNEHRPKLNNLLKDPNITNILVEHKDRLGRHNVQPLISALEATNRKITIVNNTETEDDLVTDVLSILTSYAAKIHGQRSAKNRARKALAEIEEPAKGGLPDEQ